MTSTIQRLRRRQSILRAGAVAALLCVAPSAFAQVAPPLGQTKQFAVLGNSAVSGATGSGVVVTGDVGSSPTATVTNFPPSSVVPPFTLHLTNDGVVQQAHNDAIAARDALAIQGSGTVLPDNLATVGALTPGIYSFATGAPDLPASSTLTLNGSGVFVFNVGSSLTANVLSRVVGTANPCNIFWRVGSSAVLNGSVFRGTVIADASITVGNGANLEGRALAGTGATGAVTMSGSGGNTIGGCSTPASCPTITLSPATLPNPALATAYSQTITGSGGTAPYTFKLQSGALPAGLTLSAAGVITGTPTATGTATFTIRGTDANGCFADITYTVTVQPSANCPVITLSPATLPNGSVGVAYSQTITGSGGTAPYTFTVSAGTLPAGITLTAAGVVSGTPTTAGSAPFTIRGTDANGCFAERTFTITVAAPVPTLAQWSMIVLSALLGLSGFAALRRRRA